MVSWSENIFFRPKAVSFLYNLDEKNILSNGNVEENLGALSASKLSNFDNILDPSKCV